MTNSSALPGLTMRCTAVNEGAPCGLQGNGDNTEAGDDTATPARSSPESDAAVPKPRRAAASRAMRERAAAAAAAANAATEVIASTWLTHRMIEYLRLKLETVCWSWRLICGAEVLKSIISLMKWRALEERMADMGGCWSG